MQKIKATFRDTSGRRGGERLNWSRIVYVALVAAMVALYVTRVYAGDGNGDPHGIIRVLLPM